MGEMTDEALARDEAREFGQQYLRGDRRAVLKRRIEQAQAELDELDQAQSRYLAQMPDTTVVRFRKRYVPGGTKFWYAAIKIGGQWFTTGSQTYGRTGPMSNTTFLRWLAGLPAGSGQPATKFQVMVPRSIEAAISDMETLGPDRIVFGPDGIRLPSLADLFGRNRSVAEDVEHDKKRDD